MRHPRRRRLRKECRWQSAETLYEPRPKPQDLLHTIGVGNKIRRASLHSILKVGPYQRFIKGRSISDTDTHHVRSVPLSNNPVIVSSSIRGLERHDRGGPHLPINCRNVSGALQKVALWACWHISTSAVKSSSITLIALGRIDPIPDPSGTPFLILVSATWTL